MQKRLALAPAAHWIARLAMPSDLRHMTLHGFPALDLAGIFLGHAPTHVVPTIPLKPATRIVGMNPSLIAPGRERLTGIDAEVVKRAVAPTVGKLGAGKPAARKFAAGISHVLAAEDAKREHFLGLQLRSKLGIEISPCRFCDPVAITLLHLVVDDDSSLGHRPVQLDASATTFGALDTEHVELALNVTEDEIVAGEWS
jgi:hypothetical protein